MKLTLLFNYLLRYPVSKLATSKKDIYW